MNDLLLAARELVADDQIATDESGAEPFDWLPRTQYLWLDDLRESAFETGPSARQDFALRLVYVAEARDPDESASEEAARARYPDVTAELDVQRERYLALVRSHRATGTWLHLEAALDPRPPLTLTSRAVALRLSGYRFVGA